MNTQTVKLKTNAIQFLGANRKSAFRCLLTIALVLVAVSMNAGTIASSTFNTDREGWYSYSFALLGNGAPNFLASFGGQSTPTWESTGGNPGGFIEQQDPDHGWQYFTAPAAFLGNQSAALNGSLTFDLIDLEDFGQSPNFGPTVGITDGTTVLVYGMTTIATSWQSYMVTFPSSANGWFVTSLDGQQATPAQLEAVLGNLSGLYIRADWFGGSQTENNGEIIGLDNVVLASPSGTPEPGTLVLLGSGVLGLASVARRKLRL